MLRSLEEWNSRGYRVKKGEHGRKFVNGVAVFASSQVWRPARAPAFRERVQRDDYDYEGSWEETIGDPFFYEG